MSELKIWTSTLLSRERKVQIKIYCILYRYWQDWVDTPLLSFRYQSRNHSQSKSSKSKSNKKLKWQIACSGSLSTAIPFNLVSIKSTEPENCREQKGGRQVISLTWIWAGVGSLTPAPLMDLLREFLMTGDLRLRQHRTLAWPDWRHFPSQQRRIFPSKTKN